MYTKRRGQINTNRGNLFTFIIVGAKSLILDTYVIFPPGKETIKITCDFYNNSNYVIRVR